MLRWLLLLVIVCCASCRFPGGAVRAGGWLGWGGGAWTRGAGKSTHRMERRACELEGGGLGEEWLPVVDFSTLNEEEAAQKVIGGLQGSGFLLVRSPEITEAKAAEVLGRIESVFQEGKESVNPKLREAVEVHGKDPKAHVMLERLDRYRASPMADPWVVDYWQSLAAVRNRVLTALGRGLGLHPDYFTSRHREDNDSLRLLHYRPLSAEQMKEQTLRCKEHSDYGSITLLLRDDCPGLQLLREGHGWCDVPYVPGTLVVNAGSILNRWTGGAVKATLHRVAAVPGEASERHRYSAAFFVDVDEGVDLKDLGQEDPKMANMTAAEYVKWRSGGGDGVAFLPGEAEDQWRKQDL